MRRLGAELPYELTVEIERYEELENISKIYAIIWIERMSQKSIIIGTEGDMLKKIGTDARLDIERLIGQKVYLQLWVKVKKGWSDNERALQSLGYQD
jgi:GTP-binding protein Era